MRVQLKLALQLLTFLVEYIYKQEHLWDIHLFSPHDLEMMLYTQNLAIIFPGLQLKSKSTTASSQAGKPNRNCQCLIPYSLEYNSFDRLFKFAQLTNSKRTTVLYIGSESWKACGGEQ